LPNFVRTAALLGDFGSDWICLSSGGWWTSNPEADASKLIERNIKQGYQPKWIAVKSIRGDAG
jgi:hypothetical protein